MSQGTLSPILGTFRNMYWLASVSGVHPLTVRGAGEPDWGGSGSGHPGVRGEGLRVGGPSSRPGQSGPSRHHEVRGHEAGCHHAGSHAA